MRARTRTGARRKGPRRPVDVDGERTTWTGRRLGVVAITLFAALVIVAFLRQRKDDPKVTSGSDVDSPEPKMRATEPWHSPSRGDPPAGSAANAAASATTPSDPPPVIDDIVVEKTAVCAGEENLVTVKAHTVNGTNGFLHYVIDGQLGVSSPVRLWRKDDAVVGEHTITVFGRGNVALTVPLPRYEVKDCQPLYLVGIDSRVRSNSWGDYDFEARVLATPPPPPPGDADRSRRPTPTALPTPTKPFVATSYVWSFGDGETSTTATTAVEHNYESRPQSALYSYFLVKVEAHGSAGEVVSGRVSLALINPAFEALAAKGMVQLMIALTPRFPELGADGRVVQKVRIWHARPGPVTIEHALMQKFYERASGNTEPQIVEVEALLGTTIIPAGKEGITTTVILDTNLEPEVQGITYQLAGKSDEGYPAAGTFSVMQPPPKPVAGNSQRVFDPMLKAKIMAARAILKKDTVNDEELWQLEREGMFANLVVSPAEASAAARAAASAPPPIPRNTAIEQGPPVPTTTSGESPPASGTAHPDMNKGGR